uniref:E74 like ETS transcription factor 2 n=1 Tax=Neogobius melanostomus TaxID=47308 RepID=A0A8C6SJR8_9GOBI
MLNFYSVSLSFFNLKSFQVPPAKCSSTPRGPRTPGWETLPLVTIIVAVSSPGLGLFVCMLLCIQMLTCLSVVLTVEMSAHDMVCFDKTFEAAEALLHMESPGGLHSERSTGKAHTHTQYDVMMETVVEVSTECAAIEEEESFPMAPDCEPTAKKKKGGRKPKTHQPASNGSFDLGIKKRPKEGKGLLKGKVKLNTVMT